MITFLTAFMVGFIEYLPFKRISKYISVLIFVFSIALTWNYFKPQNVVNSTDDYYLKRFFSDRISSGKSKELSNEYPNWTESYIPLTIWTEKRPENLPDKIEFKDGIMQFSEISPINYLIKVEADKDTSITINSYYFPGWNAWIDGQRAKLNVLKPFGNMSVSVPKGKHELIVKLEDSLIRIISNYISLFSLVISFFLVLYSKIKRKTFK